MTNPIRILMFAPAFAPLANPEAIVNAKLARAFIEHGWSVEVISRELETDYDYGSAWENRFAVLRAHTHELRYARGGRARRLLEAASGVLRTRHPVAGCRWAEHALRLAMRLHTAHPFDVILSRALPDSAHLPALSMSRGFAIPWIANWNDPAGRRMPRPYGEGPTAPIGFWNERLLRCVVQHATLLTFPGERLRDYMCGYLGPAAREKSAVVPHVAWYEEPQNTPQRSARFTITYAGNITRERSPGAFLGALRRFLSLAGESAPVEFLFMGRDETGELAQALPELGRWIRVTGPQPYERCQSLLASSDLLLLIEAQGPESVFLPSKLVDYAETGRPILALTPAESTVSDYLRAWGGGRGLSGSNEEEIVGALLAAFRAWRLGGPAEHAPTARLHREFSPRRIIDTYASAFDRLGVGRRLAVRGTGSTLP